MREIRREAPKKCPPQFKPVVWPVKMCGYALLLLGAMTLFTTAYSVIAAQAAYVSGWPVAVAVAEMVCGILGIRNARRAERALLLTVAGAVTVAVLLVSLLAGYYTLFNWPVVIALLIAAVFFVGAVVNLIKKQKQRLR